MQPHQERVVQELKDLDEKISKLEVFIKGNVISTLSMDEQTRLKKQLIHMRDYSNVLNERIGAF